MKLEQVKGFVEKQEKQELKFLSLYYGEEKSEISPLGQVSLLVHQFGAINDEPSAVEFFKEVRRREKLNELKFVEAKDGFRTFVTRYGRFSAKRMSENYQAGLDRLYFSNISSKPHTTLVNVIARNPRVEQYDLVTGSADMFHFLDTEKSTGVWTSWIETPHFVLNPYFNLIMPRNEYYHLFDAHAFNRIKGAEIAEDLKKPAVKKEMMKAHNEEYLLARDELVKKIARGQMGE